MAGRPQKSSALPNVRQNSPRACMRRPELEHADPGAVGCQKVATADRNRPAANGFFCRPRNPAASTMSKASTSPEHAVAEFGGHGSRPNVRGNA